MSSEFVRGLEGVVAAETVLGWIDPAVPMIWVSGVRLPTVVARGFEAAVALLWEGFAGDGLTGPGIAASLGAARVMAFEGIDHLLANAAGQDPSDALRIGLARLDTTADPTHILGTLTVLVPALLRARRGAPRVAPDPTLSTAADLLRMLHGSAPDVASAAALDAYFTAMMETGLNTSSFACRVVASTRAALAAAVLGAWCTFTGPLHGGAPGPTLDLLDEAAAAPDLDVWLTAKIEAGERLMGFGNRLFPRGHGDPRAVAMRAALERMGRRQTVSPLRLKSRNGCKRCWRASAPDAYCRQISRLPRRSCSMRFASRARASPRSLPSADARAGSRTHWSSRRRGGCTVRSQPM
jgi:citrate synthase